MWLIVFIFVVLVVYCVGDVGLIVVVCFVCC